MRITLIPLFALVLGVAVAVPPAVADEPTTEEPTTEDEKLLRKLLGEDAPTAGEPAEDEAAVDRLESLVRDMRTAGERIAKQDTGTETRSLQRNVVTRLDELLAALEQARKQQQQSSGSPPPSGSERPQGEKEPSPENGEPMAEETPAGGEAGAPMGGKRRDDEDAAESSDVTEPGRDTDLDPADRQQLVKDVWGHLPPALRDRMLSATDEKPLPKYADLVRRYFRALAEQSREEE